MHTQIAGKEYDVRNTKHVLIEAEDYDTAKRLVSENLENSSYSYQLEDSPRDNKKVLRVYNALEQFSNATNELSAAWLELDDRIEVEEEMNEILTKHFPSKAINASFDDFSYDVNEWNRKVRSK